MRSRPFSVCMRSCNMPAEEILLEVYGVSEAPAAHTENNDSGPHDRRFLDSLSLDFREHENDRITPGPFLDTPHSAKGVADLDKRG